MENSISYALKLDEQCTLRETRNLFLIPKNKEGKDKTYFLGNSLGLQPKSTSAYITRELEKWNHFGVEAHFEGEKPWLDCNERLKGLTAPIVGAKNSELSTMNSLTVNIHLLLSTFYKPQSKKRKIVVEANLFPSDLYAIQSHCEMNGLDPKSSIIKIQSSPSIGLLRTDQILETIEQNKDEISIVWLGGTNYLTGQLYDFEEIARFCHEHDILIGLDLAHAVGNVKLDLHDWEIDFAAWCTYKYLNSGPGGIGQIFIHEKHFDANPTLMGWWGNDRSTQFLMKPNFEPAYGADKFQLSTSPILLMASLEASLEIFNKVGIDSLIRKNQDLSSYLLFLLSEIITKYQSQSPFQIISPLDPKERGAQISLAMREKGKELYAFLKKHDFFVDWREPDVMRLAPTALYNTYEEIFRLCSIVDSFYQK